MEKSQVLTIVVSVLLSIVIMSGGLYFTQAAASPLLASGSPEVVSYQGQVTVSGSPYNGTGYFKFAVVDGSGNTSYWSNDGTSSGGAEPTAAVQLGVNEGLFNVLLGDTNLSNMTSLSASAFDGTDRYLRVWFSSDGSSFTQLSPDRRVASVPYALQAEEAATAGNADTLDGSDSSAFASQSDLSSLQSRVSALESKTASMSTENGGDDVVFENVNVHIRDGSGDTDGSVNGKGNLIVGYNEDDFGAATRTGSHNLIVGPEHSYTSYGGFVTGIYNTISGDYASVSGGSSNTASGSISTVSGGSSNTASGSTSAVSGGSSNEASGDQSSVSGGTSNIASGTQSSVSGGFDNEASASKSSVSGGRYNTASGANSSVLGGEDNTASGSYAVVVGGGGVGTSDGNEAWAYWSVVVGGSNNTAGDTSGFTGTEGASSVVSGGDGNTATGDISVVSGGSSNTASGVGSAIGGGQNDTLSGDYDWQAGDLIETD